MENGAIGRRVWTQFEFNPDSKFNNLYNVNDSDNVVGNGYTITETGSSFSGPFLKWGKKDYMVEFFTGNNINDIRIRNMFMVCGATPLKCTTPAISAMRPLPKPG